MIKTDAPTPARWNNTGGDVRIHLVPAGTTLIEEGEDPWSNSFQVTTPICGLGIYHGGWTHIPHINPPRPPLQRCPRCFPQGA